jgi:aryl-alcohol dehydrogenase-like predicted oxidoreductase
MKYRRLGRTRLEVSEIGFGCGPTAGLMVHGSEEDRRIAVARALELGINYFDTAPGYGNSLSEKNLGQTLRALNAQPIVATKVALSIDELQDIPGSVVRSVEGSLARLGLSRIPLIQLHNRVAPRRAAKPEFGTGALLSVDDVLGPDGVVAAFRSLRARGLVTFFGCSAYGGDMRSVALLIDSGPFDALIVNYSVLNPSAWQPVDVGAGLRDYAGIGALAVQSGMGVIALRVLEGGILAGPDVHKAPPSGRAAPDGRLLAARADRLVARMQTESADLSRLAIRFALSNPAVSTALIGFSDRKQVEDAAAAATSGALDQSTLESIGAA